MVFQLSLDNETGEKFSVSIKDMAGTTLFQDTYSEKKFDKRFVFDKSENIGRLTFVLRSIKDNQTQVFEINAITRLVENIDVTVTKL